MSQSRYLQLRATIRESDRLNELLYDNHKGLKDLYAYAKNSWGEKNKFTIEVAIKLFMQFSDDTYQYGQGIEIEYKMVNECFLLS